MSDELQKLSLICAFWPIIQPIQTLKLNIPFFLGPDPWHLIRMAAADISLYAILCNNGNKFIFCLKHGHKFRSYWLDTSQIYIVVPTFLSFVEEKKCLCASTWFYIPTAELPSFSYSVDFT